MVNSALATKAENTMAAMYRASCEGGGSPKKFDSAPRAPDSTSLPGEQLHEGDDGRDPEDLQGGCDDRPQHGQPQTDSRRVGEQHGGPARDTEHVRPPGADGVRPPFASVYVRCDGSDVQLVPLASDLTHTLVRWQIHRSGSSTPGMAGSPSCGRSSTSCPTSRSRTSVTPPARPTARGPSRRPASWPSSASTVSSTTA